MCDVEVVTFAFRKASGFVRPVRAKATMGWEWRAFYQPPSDDMPSPMNALFQQHDSDERRIDVYHLQHVACGLKQRGGGGLDAQHGAAIEAMEREQRRRKAAEQERRPCWNMRRGHVKGFQHVNPSLNSGVERAVQTVPNPFFWAPSRWVHN